MLMATGLTPLPTDTPRTAILVQTGEELLDGRVSDTNGPWVGGLLRGRGWRVVGVRVVGDAEDRIRDEVVLATSQASLVIVGGGLGPTSDDRTRHAVAAAGAVPLLQDDEAVDVLAARLGSVAMEVTSSQLQQALFPQGSTRVFNPVGTAEGFRLTIGAAEVWVLPGVPTEYRRMVRGLIDAYCGDGVAEDETTDLTAFGIGEARLADGLDVVAATHGVSVGYRAEAPLVHVRFGGTRASVEAARDAATEMFAPYWLPSGATRPAEALLALLQERGIRATAAESCTGGGVASSWTEIAGSSAGFDASVVTYANEAKTSLLGVPAALLDQHGAVSGAVCLAMVRGVCARTGAAAGVSTTGIAGPGGGTPDKPVGLVWLGIQTPDGRWAVEFRCPDRGRVWVRRATVALATMLLVRALQGRLNEASAWSWVASITEDVDAMIA